MSYILHIAIILQIYIILALSLNVKTGFTGLLSLCQAAFYGTGAYVVTILMVNHNFNFLTALFMAIVFNVFINGVLISLFATRLRNLYFTLASLAFQIIFFGVIYNWQGLTQGSYGITGIPKPTVFGIEFSSHILFFVITSFFTVTTLAFFHFFPKSPLCRMLQCVRDDEVWMVALGKNPAYFKFIGISISAVFASIAGGLYATYMSYIDPTCFTLDESILILTIILIGGTGNIIGPISGAILYVLLPEFLRFVNLPDALAANVRMIIYAMILLLIIRLKPNGLFGRFEIKG